MQAQVLSFASIFEPATIALLFLGVFLGIVIGALPGLTATMAISLLVSLTYGMDAGGALVVLIAVYLAGIYGGSRSAILLNVPGTPSSAATALEGFPLTKKGEGIYAGIVVTASSTMGGILGALILIFATPIIAKMALKIGFWEYFWLGMFGVAISGTITSTKLYKGLLSGMVGLFIACIGIDGIYGITRFSFGSVQLMAGISLVPAMIGLFGLSEAFIAISDPESHVIKNEKKIRMSQLGRYVADSFLLLGKRFRIFLQSSVIGTLIGALPGVGPDVAAWVSYDAAKRSSKEKELFGRGSYDGLIGSETANNAATSGVFIPLITLGVPGCAVSAIIMGGMQLHGYRPGPMFLSENPGFMWFLSGILILVNLVLLLQGVILTPMIGKVLSLKVGVIMPIVVILTVMGAYAVNIRSFDITVMLFFGFLGFLMKKLHIPPAPMALGIILGNLVELNFRRGVITAHYSMTPFFTRPVSLFLVIMLVLFITWPLIRKTLTAKRKAAKA